MVRYRRYHTILSRACRKSNSFDRIDAVRAPARRGRTRGETRSFSPLANHPFSFGREQTHRYLPKDLRHLLPQIRARFARKVRNAKLPAAHVTKATRRAGTTPQGRALPLGWQPIPRLSQQKPGGNWKASLTLARAARPEGKRVIDKREKTIGCLPLARPRRAGANPAHLGRGHPAGRAVRSATDSAFTVFLAETAKTCFPCRGGT